MASFRSVYCKFSECNVRPANIAELVLALWLVVGPAAWGQTWPVRPISVVVPFTPGTGIDLVARGVGARLSERLGVPVVIDNRAGASGNIGSEFVARAAPDGHILIVTAGTFVNNTAVNSNLRYDPIRDFAPIALLATGAQMFIVGPASSAMSVKEVVAMAIARPGKMFYASPGNGTIHHLAMELFKFETGADIVHVPYKGFGGAINDVVGGRVEAMILPMAAAAPYVQSRQVRVLAVLSKERAALFPNVPTLGEEGYPGVQADNWYAMLAPARTPAEVVTRLNTETNAVLRDPAMSEALLKQSLVAAGGPAELLASLMKSEMERWRRVAIHAKIRAD